MSSVRIRLSGVLSMIRFVYSASIFCAAGAADPPCWPASGMLVAERDDTRDGDDRRRTDRPPQSMSCHSALREEVGG